MDSFEKQKYTPMAYDKYLNIFLNQVHVSDVNSLSEEDKKYLEYRKLNFQRSRRVEKTFEPTSEAKRIFSEISSKQKWIVITESWCGDSSQNLPVIAKLAALNNNIEFEIVLRDSNLTFMDFYLTNGSRSIPKLIVFDKNEHDLFQWGPRPAAIQKRFVELKISGMEKSEINKELHLWYSRNKGSEVEREILELLKTTLK